MRRSCAPASCWLDTRRPDTSFPRNPQRIGLMEPRNLSQPEAPSKAAIAKASGIALAVALVILFTTVLPAEYGIDPLKTGAGLGLTDLSKAKEAKLAAATVTAAPPAAPVQAGVYTAQPAR